MDVGDWLRYYTHCSSKFELVAVAAAAVSVFVAVVVVQGCHLCFPGGLTLGERSLHEITIYIYVCIEYIHACASISISHCDARAENLYIIAYIRRTVTLLTFGFSDICSGHNLAIHRGAPYFYYSTGGGNWLQNCIRC